MLRAFWPGLPLGLLLLPMAAFWIDAARATAGRRYAYDPAPRRVVVLGFDGVDPGMLEEYLPRLPALQSLARKGSFLRCRTTNPPESPVAWATFATGDNPGEHGIFDFVRRDLAAPDCYRPENGLVERVPPVLGPLGFPVRPPRAVNLRGGEPFWEPVARLGYKVSVLRMPLTFPARLERGGELLCGLGVPDLRATQGSYTLFAAGRDAREEYTEFGGRHTKIYPRDGIATADLEGPPDPRDPRRGRLKVPVRFTFTGGSAAVTVGDGPAVALEQGLYSRWTPVTFRAGFFIVLQGMVRFLLLHGGEDPAIYASPIQIAPNGSPIPISAPPSFAGEMARRLGFFKTAGWPEDTFAANEGVLDDTHAFEDIRDTYRSDERLCLDRLDRSGAALLTMVFTAQDRIAHLFYRYRDTRHPAHDPAVIADFYAKTGVDDPIFESYRWMNDTVAEVARRLGPRDVLLIVSDHGFHSFRWGMNINTWLAQEGYLTLADEAKGRHMRDLDELFRRGVDTSGIDWTRTRAYALGLGQIYLNLAGRERDGIVKPEEREALLGEITRKLVALRGPDDAPVLRDVYRGDEIWSGSRMAEAPELQCAFAEGYRVSWQTALLNVPPGIFEANKRPWSGDHCSNDQRETPGIFLSNVPLGPDANPGLEDIAPTVKWLFGIKGEHLPLLLDR
ncbi:MAG TPA: alkaline phosphatase family protein [Planctomycetota bacterium]|nr:alkaline phosphatase family protein [Planctomycetota bacterium]